MLSFRILTEENITRLYDGILSDMPEADGEYLLEIMNSLLLCDEEAAVSWSRGCLLIRIFDGVYSFAYPIELFDGADPDKAAMEIREYAVREDLPLVYTDVPRECLGGLISSFRHMNVDASDADGECFTVRVMSEAALMEEIPSLTLGDLTVDAITPEDDAKYAALCKDDDTNRFWGYDYSSDIKDPPNSYFREENKREIERGVLVPFALRVGGEFAGEALLSSFDLLGGCQCAVRLLPEFRRGGYATAALNLLKEVARRMGLVRLSGRVMADNIPSIKMCEGVFDSSVNLGDVIEYTAFL